MPYEVGDIVRVKEGSECCRFEHGVNYEVVRKEGLSFYIVKNDAGTTHGFYDTSLEPVAPSLLTQDSDPNRDPVAGDVMYVTVDGPYCFEQAENRSDHKIGDQVRITGAVLGGSDNFRTRRVDGAQAKGNHGPEWTIRRDQLSFTNPLGDSAPAATPSASVRVWAPGTRVKTMYGHEGVITEKFDAMYGSDPAWRVRLDGSTGRGTAYWQRDLEFTTPDPNADKYGPASVEDAWKPGYTVRFTATGNFSGDGDGVEYFSVGCKSAPFKDVRPHIVEMKMMRDNNYEVRLEFGPLERRDYDSMGIFRKGHYSINASEAEEVGKDFEIVKIEEAVEQTVEIKFTVPVSKAEAILTDLERSTTAHPEALKAVRDALTDASSDEDDDYEDDDDPF
jgi:hypothetical protein